jgi:hypothetical protein
MKYVIVSQLMQQVITINDSTKVLTREVDKMNIDEPSQITSDWLVSSDLSLLHFLFDTQKLQ